MASTIKVDKLDPQSGTALEIGTSGDTVTVPSGVGLTLTDSTLLLPTTIKTDKLDPKSGTALEIGTSGDTITVPTGAGLTVTDEVKTNKISPATGVAFALGDSGDTFTVPSGATIVNSGTATGFGGGKILQVVSTNKTDQFSESTSNGVLGSLVTGLTVAITPAATSSKILVLMNTTLGLSSVGGLCWGLFRDTTQIDLGDADGSRGRMSGGMDEQQATQYVISVGLQHLDSPSSTSEVVYGIKLGHTSGSAKTIYVNVEASGSTTWRYPVTSSNITAIEVGV
tara:strand:- start:307 stop:1155 length:849 start_codon:yes stop_codon:yes gene_type:complete